MSFMPIISTAASILLIFGGAGVRHRLNVPLPALTLPI